MVQRRTISTMKKPFKKANASTPSRPLRLWKKYVTHPKLMIFLIVLLLLPVTSFSYGKYKDWDNAQMIKGIAKDFPQLVAEVENATGLDLEIKSNCMTTQEKSGNGVRTCELSIAKDAQQSQVDSAVNAVKNSSSPSSVYLSETMRTYKIEYRGKRACSISSSDSVYISCIIGVRDANTQLALDLF